jgi:GTPase involved in cell partitioning and DNA repair
MKLQRFVDFKPVLIKSGNGGDGAIAFARSIQQPLGPPSGGNGGNGSNVWIVASTKVTSLNGIQNKYIGPNGKSGQNKHMHGANAPDLQIIVPTGTTVKQINSRENEINLTQIVDRHFIFRQGYRPQEDRVNMLMERVSEKKPIPPVHVELAADGDKVLVAKGGQGGYFVLNQTGKSTFCNTHDQRSWCRRARRTRLYSFD